MIRVCKKPLNCSLKWMHHCALPPAWNESSVFSTSLPAFGVSALDFDNSKIVSLVCILSCFLICSSLMTYNVEYLFMCLSGIWISSVTLTPCDVSIEPYRKYKAKVNIKISPWVKNRTKILAALGYKHCGVFQVPLPLFFLTMAPHHFQI